MPSVRLTADKLSVRSHLVGDNNKLTFDIGHYHIEDLAKLMLVPDATEIKLIVEWNDWRNC